MAHLASSVLSDHAIACVVVAERADGDSFLQCNQDLLKAAISRVVTLPLLDYSLPPLHTAATPPPALHYTALQLSDNTTHTLPHTHPGNTRLLPWLLDGVDILGNTQTTNTAPHLPRRALDA